MAAHLLDGNIRNLSIARDKYVGMPPEKINSYQDLLDYLNKLNQDWVLAMKRVSPNVLIELLEITGKQYSDYLNTLDPFEEAIFSVGWAGEEVSKNWFHIAREYTEKWHHQQQIRMAVGGEKELYEEKFYHPYLETSMRALPHHYRNIEGLDGEAIQFEITGTGGGIWYLYSNGNQWTLLNDCEIKPVCSIGIEGEIAWRIFTKGIKKEEASRYVAISGKKILGERILDMVAVMA